MASLYVDLRFLPLSIPALSSPADAEWRKGGGSQSQSTHTETHLPPIKQQRRMMGNGKDAARLTLPVGICPRRNVVFASVGYETDSVGVRLITSVVEGAVLDSSVNSLCHVHYNSP